MRLDTSDTNVVAVGIWNPAILSPDWVARVVFGRPRGVEVPIEIEMPIRLGAPWRFTIDGFRFIPHRNRLVISPRETSAELLVRTEQLLKTILRALPHTPITALGYNFHFVEDEPREAHLEPFTLQTRHLVDHLERQIEIQGQALVTSIRVEGRVLNLKREIDEGRVKVEFNFHYAGDTSELLAIPDGRLADDFRLSMELAANLFGELEQVPGGGA